MTELLDEVDKELEPDRPRRRPTSSATLYVQMCYPGQNFDMSVPVPEGADARRARPARPRRALPRPARGRARLLLPHPAAARARRARHRARASRPSPTTSPRPAPSTDAAQAPQAARAPRTGATGSSTRRSTTAPQLGAGRDGRRARADRGAVHRRRAPARRRPPTLDASRQLRHLGLTHGRASCSSPTSTGIASGTASFEVFRGRLVDAIDAVLDLLDADPGLPLRARRPGDRARGLPRGAARPARRARRRARARAGSRPGRGTCSPTRCCPAARRTCATCCSAARSRATLGPVSRVAYVPDSFGHPAQFPQLFAGFGLDPFVYWRGNGAELDALGPLYRWRAPDGIGGARLASRRGLLRRGRARRRRRPRGDRGAPAAVIDRSSPPRRGPGAVDERLRPPAARHLDRARRRRASARSACCSTTRPRGCPTRRHARRVDRRAGRRAHRRTCCPACGRRACRSSCATARSRRCSPRGRSRGSRSARALGLADERPALDAGVAVAAAATRRTTRSAAARSTRCTSAWSRATTTPKGSARATVQRVLERLAGAIVTRDTPWSRRRRTVVGVQRVGRAAHRRRARPARRRSRRGASASPASTCIRWRCRSFTGVTVDGRPARLVASDDPTRVRFLPGRRRARRRVRRRRRPRVRVPSLHGRTGDAVARRRRRRPRDRSRRHARRGRRRRHAVGHARRSHATTACSGSRTPSTAATPTTAIPTRRATCDVRAVAVTRTRHASGIERPARRCASSTRSARSTVEGVRRARRAVRALRRRARQPRARPPPPAALPDRRARRPRSTPRRRSTPRPRRPRRVDDAGWVHPRRARSRTRVGSRRTASSSARPGCPRPRSRPTATCSSRSSAASARSRASSCAPARCPAGPEMLAPGAQTQGRVARDHHARPRTAPTRAPPRSVCAACIGGDDAAARRRTRRCSSSTRSTRCSRRASPPRTATASSCAC